MGQITGIKPGAKYVLIAVLVAAAIACIKLFVLDAPKEVATTQEINKFQLSEMTQNASLKTTDAFIAVPKDMTDYSHKGTQIIWQLFQWNSQFPNMYAAGGKRTVKGSLYEKYGVNVEYRVQPDCFKTIADYIANTQELKDNPNTVPMFATFMGDGMPGFSAMLADMVNKLGKEYQPIIFYTSGRSDGEDGFWGPKEWKIDPQAAKGHTVAGVERDGDVNIVLKWAADNNVPINANTKYFDSSALNIIAALDYIDAGNKYINGFTEERILVVNGKTTTQKVTISTDAYTSWTPVDVTVAKTKGGLVKLASTHEYTSQMPNMTIVCKKWALEHRDVMRNIILALGQAGDQVRSFPEAQMFAAQVSAEVYGEKDATYWLTYWKGIEEKDATGMKVKLGGSAAFNLADAANVFGLGTDKIDRYKVTYETFGNILEKLYPDNMLGWMSYKDIVDKQFLLEAIANSDYQSGDETKQDYADEITTEVSNKSVTIEFDNNSAVIKPSSYAVLNKIFNDAIIAEGLKLGVIGHTNAVGSDATNVPLSQARAAAVVAYLKKKGLNSKQLDSPKGVGSDSPLPGTDPADPANRRVEIILGN